MRSLAAMARNSSILALANRQPSAFSSEIRAILGGKCSDVIGGRSSQFVHDYTRRSSIRGLFLAIRTSFGRHLVMSLAAKLRNVFMRALVNRQSSAFSETRTIFEEILVWSIVGRNTVMALPTAKIRNSVITAKFANRVKCVKRFRRSRE